MSLDPVDLDDMYWEPAEASDREVLQSWKEKLLQKYPVVGCLRADCAGAPAQGPASEGLRQRAGGSAPSAGEAPASGDGERCPISGKQGTCPMASILGLKKGADEPADAGKAAVARAALDLFADPQEIGEKKTLMGGSGKSLTASYTSSISSRMASGRGGLLSEDCLLWQLCPLHWDSRFMKLVAICCTISWCSGLFCGWFLHRKMTVATAA